MLVSTTDIPRLHSSPVVFDDPSTPERKNMRLPLTDMKTTPVIKELEVRKEAGNTSASDFWKLNKKILEKMISL